MGQPPRSAPVRAGRCPHPHPAAAVNSDAAGAELALERLVLEGGPHGQAAAAAIGLGCERQRRAAELMVLAAGALGLGEDESVHSGRRTEVPLTHRR